MELHATPLSTAFLWTSHLLFGAVLFGALRMASWRRLTDSEQLNVFLGACVVVMVLWSLRTEVLSGVFYHLLGVTSLTLMFGWSLGIIASTLALLGVTLAHGGSWAAFSLNALLVAVPITLTQTLLILVRAWLPRHFFIYVFINAFLAAGLSSLSIALVVLALVAALGEHNMERVWREYVPLLPLMFFPEAVLNGMLMSILVAMRPQWVSSFDDRQYLDGK